MRDTEPPVAVAGDDLVVIESAWVLLDGCGSSDNVGIVTYGWSIEGTEGT